MSIDAQVIIEGESYPTWPIVADLLRVVSEERDSLKQERAFLIEKVDCVGETRTQAISLLRQIADNNWFRLNMSAVLIDQMDIFLVGFPANPEAKP